MTKIATDKKNKKATAKIVPVHSQAQLLGRTIPESLAAEAAVLGSMIVDPVCVANVVEVLNSQSFNRIEHQMIFEALIHLYENNSGHGIDAVLLKDELERRKQLKEIGSVEYLAKIMESVPSSANIDYYASIVKAKALQRSLIVAATEILNEAYDPAGEVDEKVDNAEQKIFAVTSEKISKTAETMKSLVTKTFDLISKRKGHHVTGISTGFYELDDMTSGLQNGEMIIVAARPSMGKTALALNIAEYIGIEEQKPVAIFSLEMGSQQLAERFLCSRARADSQRVRKGMIDDGLASKLAYACEEFATAPIFIDDTPSLTPLELRAKARRLKSQYDISCIVVDYLQLMHISGRVESRQQEITTISRYLKATARELKVPIVVLSQLNRAAEGREGHRPRMSDLRESGSIEQDADVVMLLHREDYYHKGDADYEDNNTAEIIIAKQRNGPTGSIEMVFLGKYTRFENASHIAEPDLDYDDTQTAPF